MPLILCAVARRKTRLSARSWLTPHADIENGRRLPQDATGLHAQEEHADHGNRRHAAKEDVPS